jgi:hypothetical protein
MLKMANLMLIKIFSTLLWLFKLNFFIKKIPNKILFHQCCYFLQITLHEKSVIVNIC